jgi:hypothetical protein
MHFSTLLYSTRILFTHLLDRLGLRQYLSYSGGHLILDIFHSSMHINPPRQPVMCIHPRRILTSNTPV